MRWKFWKFVLGAALASWCLNVLPSAGSVLAQDEGSGAPRFGEAMVTSGGRVVSQRCRRLAFQSAPLPGQHPASIDDLLHLRDFGAPGLDVAAAPGFALSPGGRYLAVQVRQAEPASNTYCQALLVFDMRQPNAPAVTIALGSELARETITLYGMAGFPSGTAKPLTPQWSPDGHWLAFIQRMGGLDGLFVASLSRGSAMPVARPAADVVSFAWTDGGLEYETDAPLRQAQGRLDREGLSGYRYDNRFWMLAHTEPFVRGEFPTDRFRVAFAEGRASSNQKVASPTPSPGDKAWVAADSHPDPALRTRPHAQIDNKPYACNAAACEDAVSAWWSDQLRTVVFLRREGFASSSSGLYRWRPAEGEPRRILVTDDALTGCTLQARRLLCGRERSAFPRDIVAIDLDSGAMSRLVDLSPEWGRVAPARVRRLRWTNHFGVPAIGDLVLPARLVPGARLPLVVVQYDTRGFLRGGIGDEYPIQAFASAGFAVLSISRPADYGTWLARAGKPVDRRQLMEAWMDRASAHDSLAKAIDVVGGLIPLDRDHLAVTGLSDGASTATYALIHGRLFSLALLSTCCEDPAVTTTAIGPAYEDMQREYEYPLPWDEHQASWREMSLAMNAGRVCAQIQVQAADSEARMAMASVSTLRRAGLPIELYVFPGEYHVKWQPAHRAAIYRRNLEALVTWQSRPALPCFAARAEGHQVQ